MVKFWQCYSWYSKFSLSNFLKTYETSAMLSPSYFVYNPTVRDSNWIQDRLFSIWQSTISFFQLYTQKNSSCLFWLINMRIQRVRSIKLLTLSSSSCLSAASCLFKSSIGGKFSSDVTARPMFATGFSNMADTLFQKERPPPVFSLRFSTFFISS